MQQQPCATQQALETLCQKLKKESVLAVDTEFIRETTFFPKIALIQIGTDQEVFLIDPLKFTPEGLSPLVEILTDPKIVKVIHAAYSDQECFYWTFGKVAFPVLDTAVASALLGMGENIGLSKLARELIGIHLPKGRARAKWLMRPLPDELLHYAEEDVRHLVELYRNLMERLEKRNRVDWAFEESEVDPKVFEETPENMAAKIGKNAHLDLKAQPALIELVRWREKRAREANLPRQWVADNEILLSLSRVRPKNIEELRLFRGLNPKEIQKAGDGILHAISVAQTVEVKRPETPFPPRGSQAKLSDHALDFIHTYMAYLANHHSISPRFLLTGAQAEILGFYKDATIEEWVKYGIISERAAKLIGPELRGILDGDKALTLKNGELSVFNVKI